MFTKKKKATKKRRRSSTAHKTTRRRRGAIRGIAAKRSGKRRSVSVTMQPMDILAAVIGGAIVEKYKDHPQLVKLIEKPAMRYGAIAGLGAVGMGVGHLVKKPPTGMVRALLMGATITAGVSAAAQALPELTAPVQGIGRLSNGQLESLRTLVDRARERVNGRGDMLVGTGRRVNGRGDMLMGTKERVRMGGYEYPNGYGG